jgi:predicted O-methyltransferase YrrM
MALKNNRRFIGIEISPEHVEIAKRRLDLVGPQESVSDFSLPLDVPAGVLSGRLTPGTFTN